MQKFFSLKTLALTLGLASSTSLILAAEPEVSVTTVTTAVTLSQAVDYHITAYGTATDVISGNGSIDIRNENAWVFIHGQKPSEVISKYVGSKIKINGAATVLDQNCMVSIYRDGTVVIPHGPLASPLTCYTGENYTGTSAGYGLDYHTNLGTMDNQITSFKLKRGYMATLAQRSDGTGYSRVFIAQDNDIEVSLLQSELKGKVSFIRVFKWNWTGKRGYSGSDMTINEALKTSWYYNWDAGNYTRTDREYVVHRHHPGWPGWDEINNKDVNVTHLLGYNEPDNTSDSREHYVDPADVISAWPEMLNSGMRVGSPANTSINTHLYTMLNGVKANGQRMDYAVVHCYWGGGSPSWVMSQLKTLHDNTGLPIWITELNYGANWTTETFWENRDNPTANDLERQRQWVAEMVSLLESADYIERYAIYNWVQNCRKVYDEIAGQLTPAGVAYSAPETRLAYNSSKAVLPPVVYLNPKGLMASFSSSSSGSVLLQWQDPNGETTDYLSIQRKTNNGTYQQIAQITASENLSLNYTDQLSTEGDYSYRIAAYFPNGEVRYSEVANLSYFSNMGNDNTSLNVSRTSSLQNPDFESSFSVLSNSGVASDRAIYVPEGWTSNYSSGNENDMSILNSSCLSASSFSTIPFTGNAYLVRQKWGASTVGFSQQIDLLDAGCYTLKADAWKTGSGGNGILWVQTQDGRKYSVTVPDGQSQWQSLPLNFYHNGIGPVMVGFAVAHTSNGSEQFTGFNNITLADHTANRSAAQLYQVLTDMVHYAQTLNVTSSTLLTQLSEIASEVSTASPSTSRATLYTLYGELGDLIDAMREQAAQQDMTGYIVNSDFESTYSVLANSGVTSDRAIYVPQGWTANYTQRDVNDMTILNTSGLAASNFTGISWTGNAYLVRQKWGTSSIELSQQLSNLPHGYYYLSADVWKSGAAGNGTIWVQVNGSSKITVSAPEFKTGWQDVGLIFDYTGTGTVTIGFSAVHSTNGTETLVGFDNFKLSQFSAGENYTSYLVNPAFDNNNGTGWTDPGTVSNYEMEFYNKNFDTYQVVNNLPNGLYQVLCQGFYRAGGYAAAATAKGAGTETLNAYLYANESSTPLMSIFEGAGKNGSVGASSSYGYVPNTMEQAQSYFTQGLYNGNSLLVRVTDNTLRVGVRKSSLISTDWTIFDKFQLRLLAADGTVSSPDVNPAFSTEGMELTDTKPVLTEESFFVEVRDRIIYVTDNQPFELFTTDGVKLQTGTPLPNGIYLVHCRSQVVRVQIQ